MQDIMQAQTQPFIKLAQANMDLFAEFSNSSEVKTQATTSAANLFQQATDSATKLMQSSAFSQLIQGLVKNYTEFMTELSQGSMALLGQGQAALVRQTQQVTDSVVEATDLPVRRPRQAA